MMTKLCAKIFFAALLALAPSTGKGAPDDTVTLETAESSSLSGETEGGSTSIIHIWEGTKVNKSKVTLELYLPEPSDTPTTAIIVCPGGSYCWLDYETEGQGVAEWLRGHGIAAFVLRYRVAGVWSFVTHDRLVRRGHQFPDMITDAQRAIQIVRERAKEFNIDPDRLGVMGFSAGGHLAMSTGTYFNTNFVELKGVPCNVNLKPNFVAPIYPVVSMSHKVTHKRSRRGALGEYRKFRSQMRDSLSLEKQVRADAPPVFLMNCVDDPIVIYRNSELLDSALTDKGVPHLYIQYKTGGHGFGASETKGTPECRQWKERFIKWLSEL